MQMEVIISVGVSYSQVLEDVRAMIRHELKQATAIPAGTLPSQADELLSIREAATLLGVTVQTIHFWKKNGALVYYKLGSRSYLKRADVMAALQAHTRTVKSGKRVQRG